MTLNGCLLLILLTLSDAFSQSAAAETSLSTPLQYSLYEELHAGTVVGNVRRDSNISSRYTEDEALILRFSFRQSLSTSWKLFTIDESDGVIRTAQVLDRDVLCAASPSSPCDLVLDVAVKPLQYFEMIKVVVRLVDVNDNAPRFRESRVAVSVAETSLPGALFPLPVAEDADSGRLGVQEYQLLSDFDGFELKVSDHVDGSKDVRLRLAKSVDRETVEQFHAVLLALDGGVPQKSGSISVEIVVLDANDNSPRFENSSYEVSIEENAPPATTIVRVLATDPDQGLNGEVVYSFTDQTDLADGNTFGIDNTNGDVYLKTGLDYEQVQTIQLTVQCRDRGPNSLPAFARVTVHVLDVNDNSPVISVNVLTSSGRAEVQENSDRGSFVAHVAVKDVDAGGGSGGGVGCQLIDGRDLFRLEPLFAAEYKIVTAVTFDREQRESYSVLVTCSDNGLPPLSSSQLVRVFVTDENDHSPKIARAVYEVELPENSPPDAVVLAKIEATDDDSGKNQALRYRISSVDPSTDGVLSVDTITGKVTANVAFDYEDRRRFAFVVTVTDQGDEPRTSTASLVLHIRDVNDERPTFDRSVYHFATRENLPVGTVIGRVSATDRDLSPDFRQVVYGLRLPSDDFEVDRVSGELMNLRRLDRETEQLHRLTVVASNRGQPDDFDGTVNVTVTVEDENDNAPVFTFPSAAAAAVSKTVQVSGTALSVGLPVARLVAVDADSGTNARIGYEILQGNEHGMFEVDAESGIVTVATMPAEATDPRGGVQGVNRVFRLSVAARDAGSPPLVSVADLVVLFNNSVEPNYAAHEGDRRGAFDGTAAAVVVAGTVLGAFIVLTFVAVVVFVLRRRRRRRRQRSVEDKLSSAEQIRPLSRAARSSCRSLTTVDDSVSIGSSGGGSSRERGLGGPVASCRRHRVRNPGGSMMLPMQRADSDKDDDRRSVDRLPTQWPLRPSQSLRIPKVKTPSLLTLFSDLILTRGVSRIFCSHGRGCHKIKLAD